MSIATELYNGGPDAPTEIEGDGWQGALMVAAGQIVEGEATCEHCGEPATVLIATGPDPEFQPMCWEAGSSMLAMTLKLGATLFGKSE